MLYSTGHLGFHPAITRPIASRILAQQVSPAVTTTEAASSTPSSQRRFFMGNKMSAAASTDVKGFIDQEILRNEVVIFSKSYCPYCHATKRLFGDMSNVQVATHELDQMPTGSAIQNQLAAMTGQRSVPNVFVNQQHVGGNDDTHAANRNGTLAKLLQK